MKNNLMTSLAIVSIFSSLFAAEPEFTSINKQQCTSNGGSYYDQFNVCQINWNGANKICKDIGKKLPTKEDYIDFIENCGGVINNSHDNLRNETYTKCYEKKFDRGAYYWTSTSVPETKDKGVYVANPNFGAIQQQMKGDLSYVRCATNK